MPIEMEQRYAPSRPFRSGTRRRRAPKGERFSEAGASRPRMRPASLDTDNQLATSDSHLLKSMLTEADEDRKRWRLHAELMCTYLKLYERYRREVDQSTMLRVYWTKYEMQKAAVGDETSAERWERVENWLKENAPTGICAKAVLWEKKYSRLSRCQTEWIAYKADCCQDRTKPVAVPIGCNDRQCPLCAWARSKRSRIKVKQMYDRIAHPVLFTLTIPNLKKIRKGYVHHFRKMVRTFLKQNEQRWEARCGHCKTIASRSIKTPTAKCRKCRTVFSFAPHAMCVGGRLDGGIYSIEATFNREEHSWHLHAHVLASMTSTLPKAGDGRVEFFGERVMPFVKIKWEWEFDWRMLCKGAWAKMPKPEQPGKARRKWADKWDDYRTAFQHWVEDCRKHSTKWAKFKNSRGKYEVRRDLSIAAYDRYFEMEKWNSRHRRIFHVQPVYDREGAVYEVLKYITKGAQFSDLPEAVEEFAAAVAGARMVQTFGSWYGFEVDTKFDPEHLDDWGEMKCACGLNAFVRMQGVFFRRDVEVTESGQHILRRPHNHNSRGTVPRPTIRALDARTEGLEENQLWDQR